jgi:nicotinate-nucleotide adenylyltransferase
MLKLALEGLPYFEILTWELEREGPSYTVDTLKMLSKDYKNIFLILGEDTLNDLPQWKDPDEIRRLATVLSGPRYSSETQKAGYRVVEVSSTDLRERLEKRLYCEHLMPKNVIDYIHAHDLYLPTNYG